MSSVAIQGNAAGAGVFTIASPNSASSYTATLPAATGTIALTSNITTYAGPNSTQYGFNGTASRATTVMTVTAVTSGVIRVGDTIASQGGTTFGTVSSFGTGTGGVGTYNMSASGTIASTTVCTTGGTFTIPTGVTQVKVTVWGGGGGGNGGNSASAGGGGGSGGAAIKWLTGLTPGNTLAVTVGLGGTRGGGAGGTGGTSSVASGTQTISAVTATGGTNSVGGTSSGGDINITGNPPLGAGLQGGSTAGGFGAMAVLLSINGGFPAAATQGGDAPGYNAGAAGGGKGCNPTGGLGAQGLVVIEY